MLKFITPIFLIIISGGLFFSYIDPAYKEISELKEEQKQYDDALTKSKELREVRGQLLGKYNTFSEEGIDKIEKLLPDNIDNVRLIMEIDHIASRYGATIKKVEVHSLINEKGDLGPDTSNYGAIGLDFIIESGYDNFVKFLNDLGSSLRIVDIVYFSLQSSDRDLYKYRVGIKTYWLK